MIEESTLNETLLVGFASLGILRGVIETVIPELHLSQQGDTPQSIVDQLMINSSHMHTLYRSAQAYLYRCARDLDQKHIHLQDAYSAYLHAVTSAVQGVKIGLDVLGPQAYLSEHTVSRMMRDSLFFERGLYHPESIKMQITETLLGSSSEVR